MVKKKRKANGTGDVEEGNNGDVSDSVLPLFEHIVSVKPEVADEMAARLIVKLQEGQKFHIGARRANDVLARQDMSFEEVLDEYHFDLGYSLKRLVKGLPSSVENARIGFATVLVQLLKMMPTVTLQHLFALLSEAAPMTGLKGSEERDRSFGRIFGYASFLRSGMLERDSTRLDDLTAICADLMQLGEKKLWLRSSSWKVHLECVDRAIRCSKTHPWRKDFLTWVSKQIMETSERGWSPESLSIVLALQQAKVELDWSGLLQLGFNHKSILHQSNLEQLAIILRDMTETRSDSDGTLATGGLYRPRPPFCWDIILEVYSSKHEYQDIADFSMLWDVVIEQGLFASTASDARKLWGYNIFERALASLDPQKVLSLFTPKFLSKWMKDLASSDKVLHVAALRVADTLKRVCKTNDKLAMGCIKEIIGKPDRPQAELHAAAKTIEGLVTTLSMDGLKEYIYLLIGFFHSTASTSPDHDVRSNKDNRWEWIMNHFLTLVRNGAIKKQSSWIHPILDFLTLRAFFTLKDSISAEMTGSIRDTAQQRLLSVLAELLEAPPIDDSTEATGSKTSRPTFWILYVLKTIKKNGKDKTSTLVAPLEPDQEKLVSSAMKQIASIEKLMAKNKESERQLQSFETLFATTCLLVYVKGDVDTNVTFADLNACFARYTGPGEADTDGTPNYIEVLVDLMLSFLSKSSIFLRAVVEHAFTGLTADMTEKAMTLLLNVLEDSGVADMDVDESEDEEVDQSEVRDGVDSGANGFSVLNGDIKMSDLPSSQVDGSSSSDDGDSDSETSISDSSSGTEDDQDVDTDSNLRSEVARALQIDGDKTREYDEGSDDDDGEEDLMTDEQMLEIDKSLALIFKGRTESKKAAKIAAEDMTQFEHKVLDLLAIFVKRQPESEMICLLILPLLQLIKTSEMSSSVANNAKTFLRERIFKGKAHPHAPKRSIATMKEVHKIASKASTTDLATLCGLASTYLVRCTLPEDKRTADLEHAESGTKAIMKLYRDSLTEYLTKKSSGFTTKFFLDYAFRYHALAADMITVCLAALRNHKGKANRHKQGLKIIHACLQNSEVLSRTCQSTIRKIIPEMSQTSIQLIAAVAASGNADENLQSNWRPAEMKDLVKDLILWLRVTKKIVPDHGVWTTLWQTQKLEEAYEKLATSPRFRQLAVFKAHQKTIEKLIGVSSKPNIANQNDADVSSDDDE